MTTLVLRLFEKLKDEGVQYCHWKSNAGLEEALQGVGDLDLLVNASQWSSFRAILDDMGFLAVRLGRGRDRHFYGHDGAAGCVVHLHVYDVLVTGGVLLKNYHLPVEARLLAGAREYCGVPVPNPADELALLVVRKVLEATSLFEHILMMREHASIVREIDWLKQRCTDEDVALAAAAMFGLTLKEWNAALSACRDRWAVLGRWVAGQRVARRMSVHRQHGRVMSMWLRTTSVISALTRRLVGVKNGARLAGRGFSVAIVGPEGSGKSTLVRSSSSLLAHAVDARVFHAGRPPATKATLLPRLLLPLLRRSMPSHRTSSWAGDAHSPQEDRPSILGRALRGARSIMLGYERRSLLMRAERHVNAGGVAVFDRFPSSSAGAIDGPQLGYRNSWSVLSRCERALYESLPMVDLLVVCSVELDRALHRNATRDKAGGPEPVSYVEARHAEFDRTAYAGRHRFDLSTDGELESTKAQLHSVVWAELLQASKRRFGDESVEGI